MRSVVGDIRALIGVAGPPDRVLATEAVIIIEQRGFNRGRDLHSDLLLALQEQPI